MVRFLRISRLRERLGHLRALVRPTSRRGGMSGPGGVRRCADGVSRRSSLDEDGPEHAPARLLPQRSALADDCRSMRGRRSRKKYAPARCAGPLPVLQALVRGVLGAQAPEVRLTPPGGARRITRETAYTGCPRIQLRGVQKSRSASATRVPQAGASRPVTFVPHLLPTDPTADPPAPYTCSWSGRRLRPLAQARELLADAYASDNGCCACLPARLNAGTRGESVEAAAAREVLRGRPAS